LSYAYVGKTSEISIVREEFPVEQKWFNKMKVRLDLAYQSFDKDYPQAVVLLPHKKKPKQELTPIQKLENTALAKERISVEHSIGGMKRYDILSGQSRIHDIDLYNMLLATCAGLWNFYITN